MPDAVFTGWVEHKNLPAIYKSADILLLPSRFDTFSCVVLEALACGLPVVAYNAKGPGDILIDGVNGFLVETPEEMAGRVVTYYLNPGSHETLKKAAIARAEEYQAEAIMDRLLLDIGLVPQPCTV
jgi:glycosyltransferase involved in cell wall biosynthesis